MTKLYISKLTEAKTIATIWSMGVESLDPQSYVELERILKQMCSNRRINNEVISVEQRVLSGKEWHTSDCHTSDAPALVPAPCDCDFNEHLDKQLAIDEGYFRAICEVLNIDPNSDIEAILKAIKK